MNDYIENFYVRKKYMYRDSFLGADSETAVIDIKMNIDMIF